MDRLRAIEYLIRVVETGSFSSAARSFDVSPPAVTKLIAALEDELGTPLLQRDSRHIGLTPDGEEFLPACLDAMASLRAAESRLSVNRARVSGKLTVGVARAVGHRLMPFLANFLSLHPDITIDVRSVQTPKEPAAANG